MPLQVPIKLSCFTIGLLIYIYIERERSGIPLHLAVKLIFFAIGLLILLIKDLIIRTQKVNFY